MNFTMTLVFLTLFLFQTTNGEIIVTLQDADENPVIEETIEFWPESSKEALGSCITNENGSCTITVDAPSDASGFIRGSITFFSGNGKRPVIWPGGTLELTLNLDKTGQLNTNSDAYVTRTPKVLTTETPAKEKSDTATEQEPAVEEEEEKSDTVTEQEPAVEEEEQKSDTATEQEPAVEEEEKKSDTATEQEPAVEEEEEKSDTRLDTATEQEHSAPIEAQIFQGFLILILLSTLIFYFWKTKQ